jgi:hypothetical protein
VVTEKKELIVSMEPTQPQEVLQSVNLVLLDTNVKTNRALLFLAWLININLEVIRAVKKFLLVLRVTLDRLSLLALVNSSLLLEQLTVNLVQLDIIAIHLMEPKRILSN